MKRFLVTTYLLAWITYFCAFWFRAFHFEDGHFFIHHINMWGDWAVHFTMGSNIATQGLSLDVSPLLITAKFLYPFGANALSALLITAGVPFFWSFVLPSLVFSIIIVLGLYWLYRLLFNSSAVAIVASLIFLLNGGMGFTWFVQEITAAPEPLAYMRELPRKYTHSDQDNMRWISVIDSMIIPQRAFTHGFALAVIILGLFYSYAQQLSASPALHLKSRKDRKGRANAVRFVDTVSSAFVILHKRAIAMRLIMSKKLTQVSPVFKLMALTVLLSFLPIIHTHSFFALAVILPAWWVALVVLESRTLLFMRQAGIWMALGGLIAGPIVYFLLANSTASHNFFTPHFGWYAHEDTSFFAFWLKNWSITPLLAVMGFLAVLVKQKTLRTRTQTFLLWAPFFVLFVLVNVFQFHPHLWDNTKVLAWASVGMSGLAGYVVVHLASVRSEARYFARALALVFFVLMTASGALDAYRIQHTRLQSYMMYSQEELALADWIQHNTPKDAIWLTGDMHNHWLYNLTGRQVVMTFRAWLWTHGYEYWQVEQEVREFYQNPAQNLDFIDRYGVSYATIGPHELKDWEANLPAFYELFEPLYVSTNNTLFVLKQR